LSRGIISPEKSIRIKDGVGKENAAVLGTTIQGIAVRLIVTTTIPTTVTTISVFVLCVRAPALSNARVGRWESVKSVRESSDLFQ